MTAIIIIVVVALVFFVTVCVVTFMVWKRETEIRTDSIRAIESNLERLGDRLAAESQPEEQEHFHEDLMEDHADLLWQEPAVSEREPLRRVRRTRSRNRDPFSWVRDGGAPEELHHEENLQQTGQQEIQPIIPDVQEEPAVPEDVPLQTEEPIVSYEPEHAEAAVPVETSVPEEAEPPYEEAHDDETAYDMEIELPDPDLFAGLGTLDLGAEGQSPADPPGKSGRDIGRSGKKYTAEELEMLIKE